RPKGRFWPADKHEKRPRDEFPPKRNDRIPLRLMGGIIQEGGTSSTFRAYREGARFMKELASYDNTILSLITHWQRRITHVLNEFKCLSQKIHSLKWHYYFYNRVQKVNRDPKMVLLQPTSSTSFCLETWTRQHLRSTS
ncbi:hypothetical protein J6590_095852, partial [Homalodisca vitripennis]